MNRNMCHLLASLVLAQASAFAVDVPRWQVHDLEFSSAVSYENPFAVDFSAEVTGPGGIRFIQPGFYDGDGTWKIRLGPNTPGKWSVVTISSDPDLNGKRINDIVCVEQKNPRIHGGLLVDPAHPHHFVREDGTRFFYSGFECDWLWAIDLGTRDPRLPQTTILLDKLVASDFNVVYMNIYAHTGFGKPDQKHQKPNFGPPAMYAWGGSNEHPDHSVLNVRFWQHYDRVVQALWERGIEAHMMIKVYNKKVKWPEIGSPDDDMYFKYALARYAPFCNVHWDFSKESNNEKNLDYKLGRFAFIRKFDPYCRLLTTHTDTQAYNQAKYAGVLDYRTDQNHRNFYDVALQQRSWEPWPVINSEYGYEHGTGGPDDKTYGQADDPLTIFKRAWEVYMAGAYGAYYYTHTSWDVIRVDDTPTGYGYYKNLAKFFNQVGLWQMAPNDALVNSGHCLANLGREYVVYQPEKKGFALKVDGVSNSLAAAWFNPLTGETSTAGEVKNGDHRFTAPAAWAEGPVVLHVGRAPKETPVFRSTFNRPLPASPAAAVFPGETWETRTPAALGLDAAKLDQLAAFLGGRGCVIKDGYVVKTWGDQAQLGDWFSSAKPVLSTMLLFAIEEGLVKSVDQPITNFGWALKEKDHAMTFRHLGAMMSSYARPEPAGTAWSYNDYAIQLYQKTLFDKVYAADPKQACEHPQRLGALGFQDGLQFASNRRISASVRDWARICWFWMNRGRWQGRQVLPQHYFDEYQKPQVPMALPFTDVGIPTDDYLGIGSYGGESFRTAKSGPGIYGFNWWFNATGPRHRDSQTWPDAPPDTVMSLGHRGNNAAMIPSLNLMVICANGNWDDLVPGNPASKINQALNLATEAVADHATRTSSSPPARPAPTLVFPGKTWEARTPAALRLDARKLDEFATSVGGDGCVIKDGYLVKTWGEVDTHKWWASASKPVLSTLLLLAAQEGKLPGVDAPVKSVGWELSPKDSTMTFRHLANMVSGYSCAEAPGAAWGYNDFAIKLYARSLEKVFQQSLDEAIHQRLAALQFEDGEFFGPGKGLGVVASPRDFARLGWLWLNRGRWNSEEVLSEKLFVDCIKPAVPTDLPRTAAKTSDYLGIGSYGGGTDQTPYGPGVYGFNFWFNERTPSGARVWPAAPTDTYQANGMWNRDTVTVFPSLGMVVAVRGAKPGNFEPGEAVGQYNQNMKLLVDAARSMILPGED